MGNEIAQWLAGDFTLLGIQIQNWMPVAFAIVALFVARVIRPSR